MLLMVSALVLVVVDLVGVLRVRQRISNVDEVQLLSAIAAELSAGASLRTAIADATAGDSRSHLDKVRHLAMVGAPIGAVAGALADLPVNGPRTSVGLCFLFLLVRSF